MLESLGLGKTCSKEVRCLSEHHLTDLSSCHSRVYFTWKQMFDNDFSEGGAGLSYYEVNGHQLHCFTPPVAIHSLMRKLKHGIVIAFEASN
jgi:hypothetical protein